MSSRRWFPAVVSALVLCGCSGTTQESKPKPKAEAKPAEAVTGQTAFWKMYMTARTWAPDAQGFIMRNVPLADVKSEGGKAGAWEAIFISQSKALSRTYTYSVIEAGGDLHKDVFPRVAEPWSGPSGQQKPWPIAAFKVDSDKAYEVAMQESKDYVAKNKEKPINFLLESTPRHPGLTWRVFWGETVPTSNYSVIVDAATGKYLEKLR